MTQVRLAVATLAALLALAGTAGAVSFSQADRNGDGFVTYPEARRVFQGLAEVHFEKCDPDGDGLIDRGEFPLLNNFYTIMYVDTR